MDWLDLLAVQGTLKSLLQHHSSKASILQRSAFLTVQLSHPYIITGKTIALTRHHIQWRINNWIHCSWIKNKTRIFILTISINIALEVQVSSMRVKSMQIGKEEVKLSIHRWHDYLRKKIQWIFFSYWICEFNTFVGHKTDIQKKKKKPWLYFHILTIKSYIENFKILLIIALENIKHWG